MRKQNKSGSLVTVAEKKRASAGPLHVEASATASGSDGALSGVSARPLEGSPAAVTPEHTGPRYACEKCGTLGDDDRSCEQCGHWEVLDLHRASDRLFNAVLITQRLQRRRHLVTGSGLISALAGVVLLLIGTVYVAPPVLLTGLILTLGGTTMTAGGPTDV